MGKEAVGEFLVKIEADPAAQEKVKAAVAGKPDHAAAIAEVAAGFGFEFTSAEFVEAIDEVRRYQDGELSDDQLGAVAGGAAPPDADKVKRVQRTLKRFELTQIPK